MALADNLVLYLPLDEAFGNALDALGVHDFTDNNTVGATSGKQAGCRDFEFSNSESFSRAHSATLDVGNIDFFVCGWFQLESASQQRGLVGQWGGIGSRSWILIYSTTSNRFALVVSNNGTATAAVTASSSGTISMGTWYFVCAWHDSVNDTLNIQVNNGTVDSVSYSSGLFTSTADLVVGNNVDGNFYHDGLIDELGLWKRILNSSERTELYNGGSGRDYAYISGGTPAPSDHSLFFAQAF